MSKIYTSADQLIGKTPLLELSHIEKAEKLEAKLLAKLEYFNPAGSVKDRTAKVRIQKKNQGTVKLWMIPEFPLNSSYQRIPM